MDSPNVCLTYVRIKLYVTLHTSSTSGSLKVSNVQYYHCEGGTLESCKSINKSMLFKIKISTWLDFLIQWVGYTLLQCTFAHCLTAWQNITVRDCKLERNILSHVPSLVKYYAANGTEKLSFSALIIHVKPHGAPPYKTLLLCWYRILEFLDWVAYSTHPGNIRLTCCLALVPDTMNCISLRDKWLVRENARGRRERGNKYHQYVPGIS